MRYRVSRPSLYPEIGDNVRMARLRGRVSQRELGERLGVSHAAISDIERGKTKPDLDVLGLIAETLGVPLTDIVVLSRRQSAPPAPGPAGEGGT